MRVYDIFKEYIWLVQTIHRHGKISLDELNALWRETDMSGGQDFTRFTFRRHKNAIEGMFGIYIECDRNDGYKYYIGNGHSLEEDSVQNWLLSTLSVNNIISESLSIQNRIQIEAIPDNRFLSEIMEAMKKNLKVEIQYRRFGADDCKTHVFAPYALKVYQKRWYVLAYFEARTDADGKTHEAHYTIFSFDRIENVAVLKDKFRMDPDFDLKEFFRDCFGIVHDDGTDTQKIIIRAYGKEAYQMRTLPLHHSQVEINTNLKHEDESEGGEASYSDFQIELKPTLDFCGKLLSRGAWLEVLEPQSLRDKILRMHEESIERYLKTEN